MSTPLIFLVLAPDLIRRKRSIESLLTKHHLPKPLNFDGSALSSSELKRLKTELLTPNLFNPVQSFHIINIDSCNAQLLRDLLTIIQSTPPNTAIICSGNSLPSNSVFLKSITKIGTVEQLSKLSGKMLHNWIKKELAARSITIQSEHIIETLELLGQANPDLIASQIEIAALYLDDQDRILTEGILQHLFLSQHSGSEFELIDKLHQQQSIKSELFLDMLLQAGTNPFALLGLISRNYSQLLSIVSLKQHSLKKEVLIQKLGISPWLFDKLQKQAANYSLSSVLNSLKAILKADYALKSKNVSNKHVLGSLISSLGVK